MVERKSVFVTLVLVLLIGAAFALRVQGLDNSSFWQDEGLTPLRAGYSVREILSNRVIIQEGVTQDTHPPLYFLLIHGSRYLLGTTDFSFRYPSVLAGVLLLPLLYQFGRRLHSQYTGLLATLLAAVNPLQIWYAQEARMYTLVVLLGAAATYTLWRALKSHHLYRWFTLYLVLAALTFLTHYTAIFLVVAQGFIWLWLLWHRGKKRLIIIGVVAALLVALPFIPLIVPRLFTGAEANYFYVSPWIMLQDVVHGFGLGMTVDFDQLTIRFIDTMVALLLLVGILGAYKATKRPLTPLFLLVYLLAAVVGLALGSLIKPMYQGARHIIVGSPAFFLLLALAVETLPWRPLLPAAAFALLLAGPVLSLDHLYNDPSYAKDDVRALIETVEARAGEDDVVVYNNSILLALHWHYGQRPDLPVTALPVYPHLANAATEQQLAELAGQYKRIWFFVDPPAAERDEGGLVQEWLDSHLLPIENHRAHARTILVEAIAYDTRSWQLSTLPAESKPVDLQWANTPVLRGWQTGSAWQGAASTLWLDLYWGEGPAPSAERQLRFVLRGPEGINWLDYNQPFWKQEIENTFEASEITRLSYGLPLPPSTPPGEYELLLRPWGGSEGTEGEWQTLGTVAIPPSASPPPALDNSFPLLFANGLRLLGIDSVVDEVRPGHTLPVDFYWQAEKVRPDLLYEMELVGPDGQIWRTVASRPGPDWLAAADWPAGIPVREYSSLPIPADAPPGRYQIRWRLKEGDRLIPGRPSWRPWQSEQLTLGQIEVEPWPLETELPAQAHVVAADFGPAIRLYGYHRQPEVLDSTETLTLTLYWQAQQVPAADYFVFVHLVDEAGNIVAQVDRIPVDWLRPTRGWREGELLTDVYQFPLSDLPAGNYQVYVGLFEPESGQRLPLVDQDKALSEGRLLLTSLTVR